MLTLFVSRRIVLRSSIRQTRDRKGKKKRKTKRRGGNECFGKIGKGIFNGSSNTPKVGGARLLKARGACASGVKRKGCA